MKLLPRPLVLRLPAAVPIKVLFIPVLLTSPVDNPMNVLLAPLIEPVFGLIINDDNVEVKI